MCCSRSSTRSTSTTSTTAQRCRSPARYASWSTGTAFANARPARPTPRRSSVCSTSSGSWRAALQPLAEPALHLGRRVAVELRLGGAAQQLLGLGLDLVPLEAQVACDVTLNLQRGMTGIDRPGRLCEQLVTLLDGRHRLVT